MDLVFRRSDKFNEIKSTKTLPCTKKDYVRLGMPYATVSTLKVAIHQTCPVRIVLFPFNHSSWLALCSGVHWKFFSISKTRFLPIPSFECRIRRNKLQNQRAVHKFSRLYVMYPSTWTRCVAIELQLSSTVATSVRARKAEHSPNMRAEFGASAFLLLLFSLFLCCHKSVFILFVVRGRDRASLFFVFSLLASQAFERCDVVTATSAFTTTIYQQLQQQQQPLNNEAICSLLVGHSSHVRLKI